MGGKDPASRRVSNLSSAQIARKRAVDRANQQQCQRRKQARMQWLEQEVARLSGQLGAAALRIKQYEEGGCACPAHAASTAALPAAPSSEVALRRGSSSIHAGWEVDLYELLDVGGPSGGGGGGMQGAFFGTPLPLSGPGVALSPVPALDALPRLGDIPEWQVLPLHLSPETDLDWLILNTIIAGRRMHQSSGAGELSHARFPSITSLLNPNLGNDDTKPLTSTLAAHVVRKSTVKSLTTRIALMYILSHLLRWFVFRSKDSYALLPDFLKPTYLQRTVPHPAWIDAVTWPQARDNIIRDKTWLTFGFDDFRRVTGASMDVSWPYTDSGAFLDLNDDQNLVLSPIFEDHILRVKNWTLGPSAAPLFPFMTEFCRAATTGEVKELCDRE